MGLFSIHKLLNPFYYTPLCELPTSEKREKFSLPADHRPAAQARLRDRGLGASRAVFACCRLSKKKGRRS